MASEFSVSLRECLLYLVIMTNSTDSRDYTAKNTFPIDKWVKGASPRNDNPLPVSPYTGHLTTPNYAQAQRLAHASPVSQPRKALPNIGSLKIKERSNMYSLTANKDGTYTTTITLDADQIENLDSKTDLPYIMIGAKSLKFDLREQPAQTRTQHPVDYGTSTSSFRSTQDKLFGAPTNTKPGGQVGYTGALPASGPMTRGMMSQGYPSRPSQAMQQEPPHGKGKAPQSNRPILERKVKSKPDEDDTKKDSKGGSRKPPKSGGGGLFGGGKK